MGRSGATVLLVAVLAIGCGQGRSHSDRYGACATGAQCPPDFDGCSEIAVDYGDRRTRVYGFCTARCTTDADCPLDAQGRSGACLSFDGGGLYLCYERCISSDQCLSGFGCVDRLPSAGGGEIRFPPICLPVD